MQGIIDINRSFIEQVDVTEIKIEPQQEINEINTFPVASDLVEIKNNLSISTKTTAKPSKEQIINQAFKFHSQGNISEALKYYQYFLNHGFEDQRVLTNYGTILKGLGKLKEAEVEHRKAIALDPNFTVGNYNLGNTLKDLGKLQEAEISMRKAIELNPNFLEAHSNLGSILKDLGKLEAAEISYRKAIKIKPDYADFYLHLGKILNDLGKLKEAEISYLKAIEIKPDYAEAAWNLYGLSNSVEEAQKRIDQCLKMDNNYLKANLIKSALNLHQGDDSLLKELIKSTHKDHPFIRSFKWVSTLPKPPELFFHKWGFFDNMIRKSNKDRPFYEFGVWRGDSFKYLINTFKKGYGFDTFTGLPENWNTLKKGHFSTEGIIPKIDGGIFIAGMFEDTLPKFFSKPRPMASIINFDADLYSSTLCALNYSKPIIDKDTILIFDEFIIYPDWENNEYKALNEFCSNNNLSYEILAVSYMTYQTALKLKAV